MIAVAFAVAAVLGQDPWRDFPVVALPEPWDHIQVQEWTYIGRSNDQRMVTFFRPARQSGKIWIRYEYLSGVPRSTRTLAELDCEGWRTRNVQTTLFAEANLSGPGSDGRPTTWTDAAPGTFGEKVLEYGCGDPS